MVNSMQNDGPNKKGELFDIKKKPIPVGINIKAAHKKRSKKTDKEEDPITLLNQQYLYNRDLNKRFRESFKNNLGTKFQDSKWELSISENQKHIQLKQGKNTISIDKTKGGVSFKTQQYNPATINHLVKSVETYQETYRMKMVCHITAKSKEQALSMFKQAHEKGLEVTSVSIINNMGKPKNLSSNEYLALKEKAYKSSKKKKTITGGINIKTKPK